MSLVETVADVDALVPADPENLAFLTQTTLSVDDTAEIVVDAASPLSFDCWTERRRYLLRNL